METKDEVLERKRELDTSKDNMDRLIHQLVAGQEARDMSLAGPRTAAAAAADHHQVDSPPS
jgi:hypothetical protein